MPKLEEVIGSFWKSTFVEFNCNFIAKTYAEKSGVQIDVYWER